MSWGQTIARLVSRSMSKRVHIIHGWAEGGWHSRKLRASLTTHGFTVTNTALQADIIIAHSAGCNLIQAGHHASIVLCINPTYWPGRSVLGRGVRKIMQDIAFVSRRRSFKWWLLKTFWNMTYLVTSPMRMLRIKLALFRNQLPASTAISLLIIRNGNDPWCTPEITRKYEPAANVSFISLPGTHDDVWERPERYVSLLRAFMT